MKEGFFCFLQYWDIDFYIDDFVEEELKNINDWYLKQRRNDDVIISASPMFLIEKFAKKINIQYVIASEVDKKTGKFSSLNCHGEEKVRRFLEKFPENEVDVFYSDSESDQPLAKIAKIAYKVHGEQKKLWMLK